jgi:hypothetical protein
MKVASINSANCGSGMSPKSHPLKVTWTPAQLDIAAWNHRPCCENIGIMDSSSGTRAITALGVIDAVARTIRLQEELPGS